jgi:hypothetical protein
VILLQSFDDFASVATLEPTSGELREYSKVDSKGQSGQSTSGFYSRLTRPSIAVFAAQGQLHLLVGTLVLEITPEEVLVVDGPRASRRLDVVRNGVRSRSFSYTLAAVPPAIPGDPTPFVDDESFDIGLLASNVSRDAERRAGFLAR